MKYFHKVGARIEPGPLLAAIDAVPHLWGEIQLRQQYAGSAHADTESIYLRGPTRLEGLFDNLDSVTYATAEKIGPELGHTYETLSDQLRIRELGRMMFVKLKPHGCIHQHIDEGAYARFFARFHYVLKSTPGCLFTCGDEQVHMAPGETWWFNHQVEHSVVNNSEEERIHLIFDATAPGYTGALSLS